MLPIFSRAEVSRFFANVRSAPTGFARFIVADIGGEVLTFALIRPLSFYADSMSAWSSGYSEPGP